MKTFFQTPERIAALDKEARSWTGTPFASHAMIKGAGVDCVHLVAGVYLAVGVLKEFDSGKYALDEGVHAGESKLIHWFDNRADFVGVQASACPTPGDSLIFRLGGRVEYHAGLMLDRGDFLNVLPGRFTIVSNLRESFYRRRITAVYRPMEVLS
jgi:cell wall-associated NlpC family hydrolase